MPIYKTKVEIKRNGVHYGVGQFIELTREDASLFTIRKPGPPIPIKDLEQNSWVRIQEEAAGNDHYIPIVREPGVELVPHPTKSERERARVMSRQEVKMRRYQLRQEQITLVRNVEFIKRDLDELKKLKPKEHPVDQPGAAAGAHKDSQVKRRRTILKKMFKNWAALRAAEDKKLRKLFQKFDKAVWKDEDNTKQVGLATPGGVSKTWLYLLENPLKKPFLQSAMDVLYQDFRR
jgi:hypothetical protein